MAGEQHIDCAECVMQHTAACDDCVVTFLCGQEDEGARVVDLDEVRALQTLARGGLVPAAVVARELGIRVIETICVASYDYDKQGAISILKTVSEKVVGSDKGAGVLIIDDLVDTGATARVVREILPKAHFATVYAKPLGRPLVDSFVTEVSQDTWIYLPWDMGLQFTPPLQDGAKA